MEAIVRKDMGIEQNTTEGKIKSCVIHPVDCRLFQLDGRPSPPKKQIPHARRPITG